MWLDLYVTLIPTHKIMSIIMIIIASMYFYNIIFATVS